MHGRAARRLPSTRGFTACATACCAISVFHRQACRTSTAHLPRPGINSRPRAVPEPSDIVVVGAGVIGCAIAWELARRGASVNVVDDRPVGMGATQASAGVLAPFIEAREGPPLLDLAVRSLDLYDDCVAGVAEQSGMPVHYRRTGTLDVALDERDLEALHATFAFLERRGVPARLLDAAASRKEEPQLAESVQGG